MSGVNQHFCATAKDYFSQHFSHAVDLSATRPAATESKKRDVNESDHYISITPPHQATRASFRGMSALFQQLAALSAAEDIIGAPAHPHCQALALANPRMLPCPACLRLRAARPSYAALTAS
jgi:hypothetical protein